MNPDIIQLNQRLTELERLFMLHKHTRMDGSQILPTASGSPGGSNKQVQFNDSSAFGGNSRFTFDKATGGNVKMDAGDGATGQNGGKVDVDAGDTDATATGGQLNLTSGQGGDGGDVAIVAGGSTASGGNPGDIILTPGNGGAGNSDGGDVKLTGGNKTGSGKPGNIFAGSGNGSIATSMDGGFLVVPFCNGTPTGVPASTGSLVYDYANNKLYIYDGGWISVTLS